VLVTTANVDGSRSWLERWRRRRILRRLAGALAASAGAAALVRRDAPALPVSVLPPQGAAVPAAPSHDPHEGLTIGFVGRLVPHRGLDTLLGALAHHRHAVWRLVVAGDGPERERLERLASELRLAARVHWVGALPPEQLARQWSTWDVFVAPSRPSGTWNEPTGTTLLEAMAHEVAVIGSDTGALPELIGSAGLVTLPGDADALAAAIGEVLDPERRAALARAARARAIELFSDDAVAERTVAFWQSVTKRGQR
jgi:glycosyltransferase involved in cell wall biosynthesis